MKDSRLFALLLLPSFLSLVISAFGALLILLAASWSYLLAQPFFATYLSGEYGFGTLLRSLGRSLNEALNSDLAYNIAVICFAILFGLGVYGVIVSFRHAVYQAQAALDTVEYADQRVKRALEMSLGLRTAIRSLSAFSWLVYTLFFFNGLLPFCANLAANSPQDSTAVIVGRYIVAFIVLLLAIHTHVIFLRLIALRPRLLGDFGNIVGRGGH